MTALWCHNQYRIPDGEKDEKKTESSNLKVVQFLSTIQGDVGMSTDCLDYNPPPRDDILVHEIKLLIHHHKNVVFSLGCLLWIP